MYLSKYNLKYFLEINKIIKQKNIFEATIPLPNNFHENEIGLMTVEEFLNFSNPNTLYHGDSTYPTKTLSEMNSILNNEVELEYPEKNDYSVFEGDNGFFIFKKIKQNEPKKIISIIFGNSIFYNPIYYLNKTYFIKDLHLLFDVVKNENFKNILELSKNKIFEKKYLENYIQNVTDVAQNNLGEYKKILNQIRINNQNFSIRTGSLGSLKSPNKIVILNSNNEIVASIEGNTLIQVAEEFQGLGLSTILIDLWSKLHPEKTSGGFSSGGKAAYISVWRKRVLEFLSNGWYTEIIKKGILTKQKVKEILNAALYKKSQINFQLKEIDKDVNQEKYMHKEQLIYSDGRVFIIYDKNFFLNNDEKFIYAYGLLEENNNIGFYYYRLDYMPEYFEIAIKVALQMVKDLNEELYIGNKQPSDYLEIDEIKEKFKNDIEIYGNKLQLKKDFIDLKYENKKEEEYRKIKDKYNESDLFNIAETKWNF